MLFPHKLNQQSHRVPGMPFAVLSCNTDSKNVLINTKVTQATVNSHINEYTQIHAFIDECHGIIKHALSEDVVVDKRVGRGGNGMYHEPLEQVLLYLGLSMKKDQTVNTSIDGKSAKRALIPGHPTNANLWYKLYKRTHCNTRLPKLSKKIAHNRIVQQETKSTQTPHAIPNQRPCDTVRYYMQKVCSVQ
jgi:hypothetical protein